MYRHSEYQDVLSCEAWENAKDAERALKSNLMDLISCTGQVSAVLSTCHGHSLTCTASLFTENVNLSLTAVGCGLKIVS